MESRDYFNRLFDIYESLLTTTEIKTFVSYYKEDLSLSEIAENRGISKSSVGKTLHQAEDKLKFYEKRLKILENKEILKTALTQTNINQIKESLIKVIEN